MWDLMKQINQTIQGFQIPNHLNPSNSESTSQLDITKPSPDWSLPKPSRAPKHLFQPRLSILVTQPSCYGGASRTFVKPMLPGTSNSTQAKGNMRTNQKTKK